MSLPGSHTQSVRLKKPPGYGNLWRLLMTGRSDDLPPVQPPFCFSGAHALYAGEANVLVGCGCKASFCHASLAHVRSGWGALHARLREPMSDVMALHLPPRSRSQLISIGCVCDWWGGTINKRLWSAQTDTHYWVECWSVLPHDCLSGSRYVFIHLSASPRTALPVLGWLSILSSPDIRNQLQFDYISFFSKYI